MRVPRRDRGNVTDPQLLRAVSNALWRPLRTAIINEAWPQGTEYTVNDPTGNPTTGLHSTASNPPGPIPRVEPINDQGRIHARLPAETWPGNNELAIRLDEGPTTAVLETLNHRTRREFTLAMHYSTAKQPFVLERNRHGNLTLRRNVDPAGLITLAVAATLEGIAALAHTEVITPELEAALIGEDDIVATIDAAAVLATLQRSGVEIE